MTGVNWKRVLVGGALAGLVLNVGYAAGERLTAGELERMTQRLGLAQPGEATMLALAVLGFVLGIVAVWLYAAMIPRYGAGHRTAAFAGTVVWILGCLVPNVSLLAFGIITATHLLLASGVDLVVVLLAAIAGSRAYREPLAPGSIPAAGAAVGVRG
jgi:hypothetical protein